MGFRLRFKRVDKVFPQYGKMRAEDFFSLAKRKKQYLTTKEQEKLKNIGNQILIGNIRNKDWFFTRTKKEVRFV